jgi:hypothetical protein
MNNYGYGGGLGPLEAAAARDAALRALADALAERERKAGREELSSGAGAGRTAGYAGGGHPPTLWVSFFRLIRIGFWIRTRQIPSGRMPNDSG